MFFFSFSNNPRLQYWQQLAKISSRKDNKSDVVKKHCVLRFFHFLTLGVVIWISTISELAYTCSCVIAINMVYENSELWQGQIQNGSM